MRLQVTVEVEGGVVTEVYLMDQDTGQPVDFELVVDDHDIEEEDFEEEEARRDEKHGLYGEHEDHAN